MARAEAASASTRSDSIKGLAQSIANPAYRRLLNAEPLLRRMVPALIVAFLLTTCVGTLVQVLDQRRQALNDAVTEIEATGRLVSETLERSDERLDLTLRTQDALLRALPASRRAAGRRIVVTNGDGVILAAATLAGSAERTVTSASLIGTRLIDLLGPSQPLTILGANAGVLELTLTDGVVALATVRELKTPAASSP